MSVEQVKGLRELKAALETLPEKIARNVMRGAMRAGAKVIQTEAKHTSGFVDHTGTLRKSLHVSTRAKGTKVMASVSAGRTKKSKRAFYAVMVEKGTKAHVIKAKPGHALGFGPVSVVHHPGARAHPFMGPAFDASNRQAIAAVAAYIRQRLATQHGINVPAPMEEGDE